MGILLETLVSQKPCNVTFGGTICTPLSNGQKSPDFSIYSDGDAKTVEDSFGEGDGKEATLAYPTVVVEVGYSESTRNLAEDCARWISCSLGRVYLAIGIDVKYTFRKNNAGQTIAGSRKLRGLVCYTWAMKRIVPHQQLPAGESLDVLKKDDDKNYHCFSYLAGQLYCYQSYNHYKFEVCSHQLPWHVVSDPASGYDTGVPKYGKES